MKASIFLLQAGAVAMALGLAGCDRNRTESHNGVLQTRFPGQVSAGGGTSGQVLARTGRPVTDATYAGGTPGIAGGSGGTTGGAATGGTVQETGQGPSAGVTPPSSAGRTGTHLPSGDMNHGGAPGTAPTATGPGTEHATGAGQRKQPGAGTAGAAAGTAAPAAGRPASTGGATLGSSTPANVASPSTAPSGVAGASMGNTETTTTPAATPAPGAGR